MFSCSETDLATVQRGMLRDEDSLWSRQHTEVTPDWQECECVNTYHLSILLCLLTLAHQLSLSLWPFLESIQAQIVSVVFMSERQRLNKAAHFFIKDLHGTQIAGANPVPFISTLTPTALHLCLLEPLQGLQSATSFWLLWLCRSESG